MASSYKEISDDILSDLEGEGAKLLGLSDEQLQVWINQAQERICNKIQIKGEFTLGLAKNVEDYPVPKNVRRMLYADRLESNFRREVKIVDMVHLLRMRKDDLITVYTQFNTPYCLAESRKDGTRYIKVYPKPDAKKSVMIYHTVRVNPRDFTDDEVTDVIQLDEPFDGAISHFVKHKIWKDKLKDDKKSAEEFVLFEDEIGVLRRSFPTYSKIEVTYT